MAKKGRNSDETTGEDDLLWQHVAKTVRAYPSIKPDSGRNKIGRTRKPAKPAPSSQAAIRRAPPSAVDPALMNSLDRSTDSRLRRGQLPLEGRIDLHGMTQDKAFAELHDFILRAVAAEKRTVLVITGKGLRSEGVLRKMLPLWLEAPLLKKHVVAITNASIKDGGTGAFYIRLKRTGKKEPF